MIQQMLRRVCTILIALLKRRRANGSPEAPSDGTTTVHAQSRCSTPRSSACALRTAIRTATFANLYARTIGKKLWPSWTFVSFSASGQARRARRRLSSMTTRQAFCRGGRCTQTLCLLFWRTLTTRPKSIRTSQDLPEIGRAPSCPALLPATKLPGTLHLYTQPCASDHLCSVTIYRALTRRRRGHIGYPDTRPCL